MASGQSRFDNRASRVLARLAAALLSLAVLIVLARDGPVVASLPPPIPSARLQAQLLTMPLSFEANQGQVDSQVQFLARGSRYTLFLSQGEAVLALRQEQRARDGRDADQNGGKGETGQNRADGSQVLGSYQPLIPNTRHPIPDTQAALVRMKMVGSNPSPPAHGFAPLPGVVNYFIGNDPTKWRTHIPTYAKVQYKDVYPGVDLVYYGTNQRQLEYDFVVAPGADPNQIALTFNGADQIEVDHQGDLVLTLSDASRVTQHAPPIRFKKPIVYQMIDGRRHDLAGSYILHASSPSPRASHPATVGFAVAAYDPTLPLIIDPVLVFSTFVGVFGVDEGRGIAVDGTGHIYVTGNTASTTFANASGVFDSTCGTDGSCNGSADAFVAKLDATGSTLFSATYLGGSGLDIGLSIALDSEGNVYLTGQTSSTDFPLLFPNCPPQVFCGSPPFQDHFAGGGYDAFVTKLTGGLSTLAYSTYLGGTGNDQGYGIGVDAAGNAYVTGFTTSTDFPTLNAFQTVNGSPSDAFVTKMNRFGSALVFSTYLGGSGNDVGNAIAVDGAGNAYVTGETTSTNLPTVTPLQAALGGFDDAFVAKLTSTGAVVYLTYLGGKGGDVGRGIAVDTGGDAYVIGNTSSTDFPTANPFQPAHAGDRSLGGEVFNDDLFVTKLSADGSALVYSTYLGGGGFESGKGIAVDTAGNAYVTGSATRAGFLTTPDAFQPVNADSVLSGAADAFVTILNAGGSALVYSTLLGGTNPPENGTDAGTGITVDAAGNVYIVGTTAASNFPTVNPLQGFVGLPGLTDAFVAKLGLSCGTLPTADLSLSLTAAPDPIDPHGPGVDAAGAFNETYTLTVVNHGPGSAFLPVVTIRLPLNMTLGSYQSQPGTSCQGAGNIVTCQLAGVILMLPNGASETVVLNSTANVRTLTAQASVRARTCDPTPQNNRAVVTTSVQGAAVESFLLVVGELVHSLNVAGIACPSACMQIYPSGTRVYLQVEKIPAPFAGWSGDPDCDDGILVMTADRQCQPNFGIPNQNDFTGSFSSKVLLGQSEDGTFFSGMPSPSLSGPATVTVSTSPPFSIVGPTAFTLLPGKTLGDNPPPGNAVGVRFTPVQTGTSTGAVTFHWQTPGPAFYATTMPFVAEAVGTGVALAVSIVGTGSGTVTGTGIVCPGDCEEAYAGTPSPVTLTATPNTGSAFAGWSGCASTSGNHCTVTAPKMVTANFRALPVKLPPPPRTPPPIRQ